jgi:hypothetical protein
MVFWCLVGFYEGTLNFIGLLHPTFKDRLNEFDRTFFFGATINKSGTTDFGLEIKSCAAVPRLDRTDSCTVWTDLEN